ALLADADAWEIVTFEDTDNMPITFSKPVQAS
ncbi:MAG: UDP-3-O-[3-hydroxymyristoyl] N-acetylglucosamine deacetylase, partial [Gammaproteobacteria bacterium]|nr:UDP-3-O-[3-hydroxymyristoyl] N-acetylglucosamine deacetylase [Gammaproteobacteria bacterium]